MKELAIKLIEQNNKFWLCEKLGLSRPTLNTRLEKCNWKKSEIRTIYYLSKKPYLETIEEKKETIYSVYALIKDKKPVYIGMTSNMDRRIIRHKEDKDFDSYVCLSEFKNKQSALDRERTLSTFVETFYFDEYYNKGVSKVVINNIKKRIKEI